MTKAEWEATFRPVEYKWYGYTGKEMLLKWNDSPDTIWDDCWIPVKIIAEYPRYLVAEVLPHINPNRSMGKSKPYRIGVNKMNLLFKGIELKEQKW